MSRTCEEEEAVERGDEDNQVVGRQQVEVRGVQWKSQQGRRGDVASKGLKEREIAVEIINVFLFFFGKTEGRKEVSVLPCFRCKHELRNRQIQTQCMPHDHRDR